VVAVGGGCSFGESGIAPPTNRIFLPAGIVADPDDPFLYVVNSNSDLRFNAGTVVAVDLAQAALVRTCASAASTGAPLPKACTDAPDQALQTQRPMCTKTRFSRTEPQPGDYCCVDMLDSNILNCNEPQFIQSNATIQIGSFGGAIQLQRYLRNPNVLTSEVVRRLFVAVRAEPSITYADVTVAGVPGDGGVTNKVVSIRCTGRLKQDGSIQPSNAFCDDNWKVRRPGGVTPGAIVLPEEPHVLALDDALGALYIGHLTVTANSQIQGGGVSTLDVSNPQSESSVVFAGLASLDTFIPVGLNQAVAALSLSPAAPPLSKIDCANPDPGIRIYALARYSAAISGMVLRKPGEVCNPPTETRDLTLVPKDSFASSAFSPHGADIRGILFSPIKPDQQDQPRAYVLYRNDSDVSANPAALVVLDRHIKNDGTPANTPIDVLEVCGGPTAMQWNTVQDRIYITCYDDGQIYIVDPTALVVTAIIDVGAGPTSLVFPSGNTGVAYVASFANSHLSVIDLVPGSPTENHVVMRMGLPHGYGE
jgi:DNA-binding beta-propeller fold protein YncE